MATAAVAENVAEAAEVVSEEAADFAEAARRVSGREMGIAFAASCVGTVGGLVIGYFFAKNRLEEHYRAYADNVVEEEMSRFLEIQKAKYQGEREQTKPDLKQVVRELGYENDQPVAYNKVQEKPKLEEVPQPETRRIFETPQPDQAEVEPEWDYATEVKSRTDEAPFIIHRDEWNAGEMEYEQASLTYFEGDDVLINELDRAIEDQDKVIGLANMLKWGHGSGDPNMLYIRNPLLGMDLEITRSMGTYASEVHGLQAEDELKHSGHRVRPRRRFDDDERT